MSADKAFIDTNILVYALGDAKDFRHQKAADLLEKLVDNKTAVISTQVLKEFYNVTTRKLNLDKNKIFKIIESFESIETVNTTPQIIINAIKLDIDKGFSIWDALIISAALQAGCNYLYTEDLNAGEKINGMTIINPFSQ